MRGIGQEGYVRKSMKDVKRNEVDMSGGRVITQGDNGTRPARSGDFFSKNTANKMSDPSKGVKLVAICCLGYHVKIVYLKFKISLVFKYSVCLLTWTDIKLFS